MRVLSQAVLVLAALLVVIVLDDRGSALAEQPHTDYMLHCQGCHGPDGRGAPGGVPSFRGTVAKFLSVPGGREYLVRVPGTSQSELSDRRVATLLNWIVAAFSAESMPPDFNPFSEAEIARIRRPPLVDVTIVRQRLLRQIEQREDAGVGAAHPTVDVVANRSSDTELECRVGGRTSR